MGWRPTGKPYGSTVKHPAVCDFCGAPLKACWLYTNRDPRDWRMMSKTAWCTCMIKMVNQPRR